MLSLLSPYKYVVDFLVIALLVAGCAFGVHKYNGMQQAVGEARVQAQWDRATAIAKDAQRQREIQFQKEKDDAVAQAAKNIQVANAAAASATQSGRVLQSTIEALVSSSGSANLDANRKYTAALATVFQECTNAYRELGREAQGHANDSLTLQHAWPH
jgi:hypothetical protein